MSDAVKKCPYCMEEIHADAKKCKFCGELLDQELRDQEIMMRKNTGDSQVSSNNNSGSAAPAVFTPPVIPKSRVHYIVLGIFFGGLGIHNFWAGRNRTGVIQLLISLFLGWLIIPAIIVGIWVLIELFSVTTDGEGVPFSR